jgi:hypothetical protein
MKRYIPLIAFWILFPTLIIPPSIMTAEIASPSVVADAIAQENATDEVDILITPVTKEDYPFPTFELGVKDEYLNREKINESEQDFF